MKVILLSFLYEPELGGGAAVVVNQLAQALVQRSHSVVVITSWQGKEIKIEYVGGIKIIRIPSMNLYWVGEKDKQPVFKKVAWQLVDIWNPLVYRLVRQILINEQADIVHSHKLRGLSPSIWSAAASAGAKKIIHTCHDFELLSPEGLFMGRVGRLAKEQNAMMRPYQAIRRHFSRLVTDATAPSKFVLDYHKKMGFFLNAIIRIIPNSHGFNETELQKNTLVATRFPLKNPARRFLYLGRLDKAKGIEFLCQAFLRIAGQKHEYLLRIAGWGPLESSLRAKYKQQPNIEFTGAVFGTQKAELFRESDVLVVPSTSPESFGLVICEAYSYGIPVIATHVGAFSEIVRDGDTGLLVKSGSVDELYSALERVSNEHSLLETMSANCLDEAQKYTTEKLFNNYLAVYGDKL
jgi:glycosyltransferase involved in cell wall biosynthesis